MRGKVLNGIIMFVKSRITPAYAGKRHSHQLFPAELQDHPCVCGEKHGGRVAERLITGSPLRMRGKDNGENENTYPYRITPAYAGKSSVTYCGQCVEIRLL